MVDMRAMSTPSVRIRLVLYAPKGAGAVAHLEKMRASLPAAEVSELKPLELDGKAVPNDVRQFTKNLQDIKADAKVDAVVLRKSRKETVKNVELPMPKNTGRPGRPGIVFPNVPFNPAGQGLPGLPGFPGGGAGNALQGSTTIKRTNDDFTASHSNNDVTVTVTGRSSVWSTS